MKKTTSNKKDTKSKYKVSVNIMGKIFKSEGDTIEEAVSTLSVGNSKGKAILVVSNGDVSKERIIPAPVAFRLFNTRGISKEVTLKNISLLFKGL